MRWGSLELVLAQVTYLPAHRWVRIQTRDLDWVEKLSQSKNNWIGCGCMWLIGSRIATIGFLDSGWDLCFALEGSIH